MLSISVSLMLILAADDEVNVISELDKSVVGVERSEISCCDSVGG